MKVSKILAGAATLAVAMLGSAFAQSNYTISEWATPSANSQPLHVVPLSGTQFYFTESTKNRIGELNTSANTVQEWTLPSGSLPHGIVLDAAGNIVFCGYSGNFIGVVNPNATTSQLTAYMVPTAKSGPIHLDTMLSSTGLTPVYYFSETLANKVAMLDPNAVGGPAITEWTVPTANSLPRGVSVIPGTTLIYFAELAAHKIALLDTSTNNITEWPIPVVRQVEHIHYYPNTDGTPLIYFGDLATSYVGVLTPGLNTVTLWPAPTANADIPDVWLAGPDLMNFSERGGTKIGFLNTTLQKGTIKSIKPPVPVMETPVVTPVTAMPFTLKTGGAIAETPTITTVTGVITGGFTEWQLPTAGSGPLGMNGNSTAVVFAEYYGSKIGTIAPAQQK